MCILIMPTLISYQSMILFTISMVMNQTHKQHLQNQQYQEMTNQSKTHSIPKRRHYIFPHNNTGDLRNFNRVRQTGHPFYVQRDSNGLQANRRGVNPIIVGNVSSESIGIFEQKAENQRQIHKQIQRQMQLHLQTQIQNQRQTQRQRNQVLTKHHREQISKFTKLNSQPYSFSNESHSPSNAISVLQQTLLSNSQRLAKLNFQFSRLHTSFLQMYNRHEQSLRQKVSQRCQQFSHIIRGVIRKFQQGERYARQVEEKVILCENTVRGVKERIRVMKIGMDCLEVQIDHKNKVPFKKKGREQRIGIDESQFYDFGKGGAVGEDQYSGILDQSLSTFWKCSDKQIPKPISPVSYSFNQPKKKVKAFLQESTQECKINNKNSHSDLFEEEFSSFAGKNRQRLQHRLNPQQHTYKSNGFNKDFKLKIQNQQGEFSSTKSNQKYKCSERVSPFEANELLRQSTTQPVIKNAHQSSHNIMRQIDIQSLEYFNLEKSAGNRGNNKNTRIGSDQKPGSRSSSQEKNQDFRKSSYYNTFPVKVSSNSIQLKYCVPQPTYLSSHPSPDLQGQFKMKIKQLVQAINESRSPHQSKGPISSYLDKMGCLRRANNTYVFQKSGEPVVISQKEFLELIRTGILIENTPDRK